MTSLKIKAIYFLLSVLLLLIGCANSSSFLKGQPVSSPVNISQVRSPEVGQEWIYIQQNVLRGIEVGVLKEKVASIAGSTVIHRELIATPHQQNYFSDLLLGQMTQENGRLASEIQGPWGVLLVDPSWGKILEFKPGARIWPEDINNPVSQTYKTKYALSGMNEPNLSWVSHMEIYGWERVTVPAGEFITLHIENQITYESPNPSKSSCVRNESLWLAPIVGRWVAKETSGSCLEVAETNAPDLQSIYRWELQQWK